MTDHSPIDGAADATNADRGLDATFGLLAHQRRRHAVACLADRSVGIALADLAEDVAAREHDQAVSDISKDTIQQIQITLYHNHIPKLTAADVVQYDRDTDRVEIADASGLIEDIRAMMVSTR